MVEEQIKNNKSFLFVPLHDHKTWPGSRLQFPYHILGTTIVGLIGDIERMLNFVQGLIGRKWTRW